MGENPFGRVPIIFPTKHVILHSFILLWMNCDVVDAYINCIKNCLICETHNKGYLLHHVISIMFPFGKQWEFD